RRGNGVCSRSPSPVMTAAGSSQSTSPTTRCSSTPTTSPVSRRCKPPSITSCGAASVSSAAETISMHELSIAQSVVEIAERHAAGRRVQKVELQVGYLRQVVPSALTFSFELVAQGTLVEGAELDI